MDNPSDSAAARGRGRVSALGWMAAASLGAVFAGVVAAACLLRFDLDRLLFPRTPPLAEARGVTEAFRLPGHDGAAMVVRRSVRGLAGSTRGCVVWFPGRHGGEDETTREFFDELEETGLVVYAVAYPGQDGAPGPARLDDVQAAAATAVATVVARCGRDRTVVAGRSLGAMVAAHAAGSTPCAGLLLGSASPSLSAGIRGALRDHWFLRPLALLPVERIVARDYSLAEALPAGLHVVVFQGDADTQTPLAALRPDAGGPERLAIIEVAGGTHADTLARARATMVSATLGMIRGSEEATAAGEDH